MNLEPHRRYLFGLCYRMTGSSADADDLVQQTFERALLARPEERVGLRPFLARVAVNLARDHLRARKRRGYTGPWLPAPIDDEAAASYEPVLGSEPRYDLLESVSFAFLLALEALTATQRAVLILRDVFDYSVRETAEALELSEANVKTTHHRARAAMEKYDRGRGERASNDRAREALMAFLTALASQDVAAIETLLRDDVRALTDGGGEYFAAMVELEGRARVMQFFLKLARVRVNPTRVELVTLNGAPAVFMEHPPSRPREAPRSVLRVELDAAGRIREVHSVLATRKLHALA
jgi:RNA polymerase sigma-70 factor (ECF subfamily)